LKNKREASRRETAAQIFPGRARAQWPMNSENALAHKERAEPLQKLKHNIRGLKCKRAARRKSRPAPKGRRKSRTAMGRCTGSRGGRQTSGPSLEPPGTPSPTKKTEPKELVTVGNGGRTQAASPGRPGARKQEQSKRGKPKPQIPTEREEMRHSSSRRTRKKKKKIANSNIRGGSSLGKKQAERTTPSQASRYKKKRTRNVQKNQENGQERGEVS